MYGAAFLARQTRFPLTKLWWAHICFWWDINVGWVFSFIFFGVVLFFFGGFGFVLVHGYTSFRCGMTLVCAMAVLLYICAIPFCSKFALKRLISAFIVRRMLLFVRCQVLFGGDKSSWSDFPTNWIYHKKNTHIKRHKFLQTEGQKPLVYIEFTG